MSVKQIVMYPNTILEEKCTPVTVFDKKLVRLLNDMYDTMIEFDGVGLAAPQIGLNKRIAIVDIEDEHGTIEMINPEVIETSGEQTDPEGCLSFPGIYGDVTRPSFVKIKAFNRKGKPYEFAAEGFLARAILHEIDHLDGILFTTKVSRYIEAEELERLDEE
ncbi:MULTISPECIES: peptide deformylase [Cytobacillus]|uniref:Peptide deformylase n=1 Tax=Cytobacillus kochii TaxID=859143 RepID=A0A248TCR5_9BACI|nr:peptide deformylase [Cytobacillus kochii]ASV66001.1 peptide deformylase [Cytobacillus kochii]MCA1028419.1 peptide deformylase [Cytobacillus kochii]MCM3321759.1 peptide deformylase [Cytobacillus kochii]MCM3343407.1 peptide deformylase [Cytobacillus kochii]MDM5207238.1 peptide deformylase [Cytobacillus kochii]